MLNFTVGPVMMDDEIKKIGGEVKYIGERSNIKSIKILLLFKKLYGIIFL